MKSSLYFILGFVALIICIPGAYNTVEGQDIEVELGDIGFDMELDSARQRLYVSVPTRNEVVIISTQSYEIISRIVVGTRPHGIDISLDGSLLFVALNEASSVVYLDLETLKVTQQVVIGQQLGDARTWDVIEGRPNRVFVSANASSSGFSYIVMVKRNQVFDSVEDPVRVASNRIIRASPVFAGSPDNNFLYVGEGFSPNSLYKLSLLSDEAPIVLEDDHGSVSGTNHLEVSPDGARIYLGSGQVLRTGSFIQIGRIGFGVPKLNQDGTLAYVAKVPNTIEVYETSTFVMVDTITTPCSFRNIRTLELLSNGAGYLILGDDLVCGGGIQTKKQTVLVANFMNGNNTALNSRIYLWNPLESGGNVTARVFTLERTGASTLLGTVDLGSLEATSARNIKLAEDILAPLEILLPYTHNGGNLTLELTIEAENVRGVAQVFSDSLAFGTYPLQEIPSTVNTNPTVLIANFMNGNSSFFNSRAYLWNPSDSGGSITARAYTLPRSGASTLLGVVDLGLLEAKSARNIKIAEDILFALDIPLPYTADGGNLAVELTIGADNVQGIAQVFSSDLAFGTYPMAIIQ